MHYIYDAVLWVQDVKQCFLKEITSVKNFKPQTLSRTSPHSLEVTHKKNLKSLVPSV